MSGENGASSSGSFSDKAQEYTREASARASAAASHAYDVADEDLRAAAEAVSKAVRDYPLAALLGAGVVGLILGLALGRR